MPRKRVVSYVRKRKERLWIQMVFSFIQNSVTRQITRGDVDSTHSCKLYFSYVNVPRKVIACSILCLCAVKNVCYPDSGVRTLWRAYKYCRTNLISTKMENMFWPLNENHVCARCGSQVEKQSFCVCFYSNASSGTSFPYIFSTIQTLLIISAFSWL